MKPQHHKSLICGVKSKSPYTQEFWVNVTCRNCLKHKPKNLYHEGIAIARRTCDFPDEIRSVHIEALIAISKGEAEPRAIAKAALTGKL